MKILYVGNTRQTELALHYFTNLVKLGYLVHPYDPDYFYARHLLEKVAIRLRRSPSPSKKREVATNLINLCKKNQFDMVFVISQNFLTAETLEEMKNVSKTPPLLVYHSHDNNFAPGILKPHGFIETLRTYDFVFTTKSQNVARYAALGQENSFFIPSAYEPSVHHPVPDQYSVYSNKTFDVTFIGTFDHSRARYLDAAGWDRLEVWGNGWKRSPHYRKFKKRIHPRAIYNFEFADVTSHTKCALGLLREEMSDLHTTRTFEIPACGAAQFSPRNQEILSYFKENEEIICFDSAEELKSKVEYYLKHDWQLSNIARKGYERVTRDHHTYLDRIKEMFQIVRKHAVFSSRAFASARAKSTPVFELTLDEAL